MMACLLFIFTMNSCCFLKLSPGVMSQGLGGSSIVLDEGLSPFHNPANMQDSKLNFTLSRWLYSTNLFCLGASFKDNAIGISYLNYGSIQGFDEQGIPTHEFSPYNLCFALGRKLGPFGIGIKTFEESIDANNLYGICANIGTYLNFNRVAIGVKIDNIGKEFSENTEIPNIFGSGLRITLTDNLNISLEFKCPDLEINSGLLYKYQNINLLFGLKYLSAEVMDQPFSDLIPSAGLIIQIENYKIGYSFVYTQFSTAHQFSITFLP